MTTPENAATRQFVLAGHATFTVNNDKGQHYTYLVKKREGNDVFQELYFVALLTGGYKYIGIIDPNDGKVRYSRYKAGIEPDHEAVKVLRWALALVWREAWDKLPNGYGIQHQGLCGKCGRKLTHPESISRGIGPECFTRIG